MQLWVLNLSRRLSDTERAMLMGVHAPRLRLSNTSLLCILRRCSPRPNIAVPERPACQLPTASKKSLPSANVLS